MVLAPARIDDLPYDGDTVGGSLARTTRRTAGQRLIAVSDATDAAVDPAQTPGLGTRAKVATFLRRGT
jgi:hypothetical protein